MPSMLTSVACVVCQVRVVDWPASRVFGLADSDAVGAAAEGGAGGGGGATFLWHAPRNRIAPRAKISVAHLADVLVIRCFTDSSSFLCARIVACDLQIHGRAHFRPAANRFSFPWTAVKLQYQASAPQGAFIS